MKKTTRPTPKKIYKPRGRGQNPARAVEKDEDSVRKCIVTGETYPKERLIRFGVSPDRGVVPDLAGKLPGRGIWVLADKDCVAAAMTKGLFTKAARGKVTCPEGMVETIDLLFVKRLQSLLGVARKAGLVVSGFEKVAAALQKDGISAVLQAVDAAADGREKIERLCKSVPVYQVLTSDEMARALGCGICVHAALKQGGAADLLASEVRRCLAYRRKMNFNED